MNGTVKLYHGDGGKHTNELISDLFYKYFNNDILISGMDSAIFKPNGKKLAYSTDTFVVKPLFFNGGDIGKLAVCGTVNDLAVSFAMPMFLSAGFIIEEGFNFSSLEKIVISMAKACKKAGVKIITGDTKVVEKGCAEGVFINTSGIGTVKKNNFENAKDGDSIIISGSIGEHGTVIALDRYNINAKGDFKSDCDSVYNIISKLSSFYKDISLIKDPTRGGIATALNEIAEKTGFSIMVDENCIPIRKEVSAVCNLLGLDPLYLACEGRFILVVDSKVSGEVLQIIKSCENGKDASIIGSIVKDNEKKVFLKTKIGGKRMLTMLDSPMLPRIC